MWISGILLLAALYLPGYFALPMSRVTSTQCSQKTINISFYDQVSENDSDLKTFSSSNCDLANMSNLLVVASFDSYLRQNLTNKQREQLFNDHSSDISSQIKLFGALLDCSSFQSNCSNRSAGFQLASTVEPRLKWTRNLGFNAQIDQVFLANDFKKVTTEFAKGATAVELQWLFDRNLLTTHLMRLIGTLSTLKDKDNGLCRYIFNLLISIQNRDPTFRLMQADIEPWISCISPFETETIISNWNQLILSNLDHLNVESQRQAVESLSDSVKWAIEDNLPTYSTELAKKLSHIGDKISFVRIDDFIHFAPVLLNAENNLNFDPSRNPMLMQVLEGHFVSNSMNRHRSHYPLGQLLSLVTPEDLKNHHLVSQIEYIVEDRTFNPRALTSTMMNFIIESFRAQKPHLAFEFFVRDHCELFSGVTLKNLSSLTSADLLKLFEKCPELSENSSQAQNLMMVEKIANELSVDKVPDSLISYVDHVSLNKVYHEVESSNVLLYSELFRRRYSNYKLTPELAHDIGRAVIGLDFSYMLGLSIVDQIDVLRIFGDQRTHFSRTEAQFNAKLFRENFRKLNPNEEFSIRILPYQDLFFMPPEMFLEFEEEEFLGINKEACQNIFNKIGDDYLLSLPEQRLRMLANMYLKRCKSDSVKRSQGPLIQRDVDTMRHLLCYAPVSLIEQMSYTALSDALIYFSRCSITQKLGQVISEKLHFVFITPKTVEHLGVNFCYIFKFDQEAILRLDSQKQHYLSAFLKVLEVISHQETLTEKLSDCTSLISKLVVQTIKSNSLASMPSLCDSEPRQYLTCPVIRSLGWGNIFIEASHFSSFAGECDLRRCSNFISENQKFFKPEALFQIASILLKPDSTLTDDAVITAAKLLPYSKVNHTQWLPLITNKGPKNLEVLEAIGKVKNLQFNVFSEIYEAIGPLNAWKVSLMGELFCDIPLATPMDYFGAQRNPFQISLQVIGQLTTCSPDFFSKFANVAIDVYKLDSPERFSSYIISKLGNLVLYMTPGLLNAIDDSSLQAIRPEILNKFDFEMIQTILKKLSVDQLSKLSEHHLTMLTSDEMSYVDSVLIGSANFDLTSATTAKSPESYEDTTVLPFNKYELPQVQVIYIYSCSKELTSFFSILMIANFFLRSLYT